MLLFITFFSSNVVITWFVFHAIYTHSNHHVALPIFRSFLSTYLFQIRKYLSTYLFQIRK